MHPRAWSGVSRRLLTELAAQRGLHRTLVPRPGPVARPAALARNWRRDRRRRNSAMYLDLRYRNALTADLRRRLEPGDLPHDFLQLSGYYDTPAALAGRARCFVYYDGNLAMHMREFGTRSRQQDRAVAYERRMLTGMAKVFTMSEALRISFIEDYGCPPEQVVTVGAGINLASTPELRPDKDHSSQEVLFVGKDFTRKGGEVLLESFRAVRSQLPRAVLHVVGPPVPPGPAPAGVQFHGYLSRDDPAFLALFQRASLFVLPSLWEPYGIAPLEAMAHQLPAVVSGRWALGENVEHGATGHHVAPGSVDELRDALLLLLPDADRLHDMGVAAHHRVAASSTWQAVAARMLASMG